MLHEYDNGVCLTCEDMKPLDDDSVALLTALNELDGTLDGRAFDPSKHLRNPKGSPGGGRFRSNVDKLKDAIAAHRAGKEEGHPFENFSREQLRRVAKARGIELKRGEDRDSIGRKLMAHLDSGGTVGRHSKPQREASSSTHARQLVDGLDPANRSRIGDELDRQAALTPAAMMHLDAVHVPAAESAQGREYLDSSVGSTLAYYTKKGASPAEYGAGGNGKPALWLSPHWHGDDGHGVLSDTTRGMFDSNWLSPSGADSPIGAIAAHEYGHHVAQVFVGDISFGSAEMPGELADRFLPTLNEALGANRMSRYPLRGDDRDLLKPVHWGTPSEPRYSVAGQLLDSWVVENKDLIESKVSRYGATNFHEMLAEIWQEYSTKGAEARPHIQAIGNLMREIAEEVYSQ